LEYVIETQGLTKIYRSGRQEIKALDGANVKVPRGAVLGLLGHNGAGKTTLISLLVGLTLPTRGGGRVLGYDIVKESVKIRRKVGLLPEGFGFYDGMTALDNLLFLGELDRLPKAELKERTGQVLETVGLQDLSERKVSTFSRGMKQRLGIAQALLKDPELLILDEPTAGIDPDGAKGFRDLVVRSSKEGRTTIISTHLLFEIGMICTHATIIKLGKVLAHGSLEELAKTVTQTKGRRYEVVVGKEAGRLAEQVKRIEGVVQVAMEGDKVLISADRDVGDHIYDLIQKGYEVESFGSVPPSWEEIFTHFHGEVEKLA